MIWAVARPKAQPDLADSRVGVLGREVPTLGTGAHQFVLVTRDPLIGDLRPIAGDATAPVLPTYRGTRRREVAGMAHIIVRIIELLVCIGLAAATTAIFVVAVITIVHGLRTAGRQR